jgi:hypothetical protein
MTITIYDEHKGWALSRRIRDRIMIYGLVAARPGRGTESPGEV